MPEEEDDVTSDEGPKRPTFLEPTLVNGYDGLAGAHDNIVWIRKDSQYAYTLNNKLIIEDTKSRAQKIYTETTVRLSCLGISDDEKFLAVGEGEPSEEGYSVVHYYQLGENPHLVQQLKLHKCGIQSLGLFIKPKVGSQLWRFMVTLSTYQEHMIAFWDMSTGCVMRTFSDVGGLANKIVMKPRDMCEPEWCSFFTVGCASHFVEWQYQYTDKNSNLVPFPI